MEKEQGSENMERVRMKRSLAKFVFLVFGVLPLFFAGCGKIPGHPVPEAPGIGEIGTTSQNGTSVRFQVLTPPKAGSGSLNQAILAYPGAEIRVTFELILINSGNLSGRTTTLSKTVLADASGTAVASFSGIPARTVIGSLKIDGGSIASQTQFHGCTDLVEGADNVLFVAPVGLKSREDIAAQVIRLLVSDDRLFAKAGAGLATTVKAAIAVVNPALSTAYQDGVALFEKLTDPAATSGLSTGSVTAGLVQVGGRATVKLPAGSQLDLQSLTAQNNITRGIVQPDGVAFLAACVATGAPVLTVVANSSENAVLLKLWLMGNPDQNDLIDASSTAEALVLYDPQFLLLSPADLSRARTALAARSDFPALVRSVETAIVAAPSDPFTDAIFGEAGEIAKGLFSSLNASPAFSIRHSIGDADQDKFVYVQDDPGRSTPDVMLVNRSFCHYDVGVTKNGMLFKTPIGEGKFRSSRCTPTSALTWPPETKETVTVEGIGEGDLAFRFSKLSALSLFDGLMGLAGAVIGAKIESMDELEDAFKGLSEKGMALGAIISEMMVARPNSISEAMGIIKTFLWEGGKLGFNALIDYAAVVFQKKLEAEMSKGWLKFVTKAVLKKALVWASLSYAVAESGAILYSVAMSPASYEESGQQTKEGWYGDLFEKNLVSMNHISLKLTWFCDLSATVLRQEGTGWVPVEVSPYRLETPWAFEYSFTSQDLGWNQTTLSLTDGMLEIDLASKTIKTGSFSQKEGKIRIGFKDVPFFGYGKKTDQTPDETRMIFRAAFDRGVADSVTSFAFSGSTEDGGPVVGTINGENVQSWTYLNPVYKFDENWIDNGLVIELTKQ